MRCALVALAVAVYLPSGCGSRGADGVLQPLPHPRDRGTGRDRYRLRHAAGLHVLTQPGVSYRLTLQELDLSVPPGSPPVDLGGVDEVDVSVLAPAGTSWPTPR